MCGTFGPSGSNGFREFVLGNLAMVKQWSLGTQDLLNTLESDIHRLTQFLNIVQACPPQAYFDAWNAEVVCSWGYASSTAQAGFLQALSLPSQYYYPDPQTLTNLITTLQASLFDVNPLIVNVSPQP